MKHLTIIFLFFATAIWSQQVRTQKDILKLPNTDLVKDFNLRIFTKNDIPVKVVEAKYTDTGFPFLEKEFSYNKDKYTLDTYFFKNKKLQKKINEFNYEKGHHLQGIKFTYNYIYDSNGTLIEEWSPKLKNEPSQRLYYSYKNNLISKIIETGVLGNGTKFSKSKIFTKTGNILSSDYNDLLSDYKFENNLIINEKLTSKRSKHKSDINYKYNKAGFITEEISYGVSNQYQLNSKNLIVKQDSEPFVTNFKYVYDKYGNWIIKYPLSYYENKFYDEESSFSIREITYSNGKTTGGRTPEHKDIKSKLLKARKELYHKIVTNNVTWLRSSIDRYVFYIADKNVTLQTNSTIMGKDLFVLNKNTKELFICKDYASKELNKKYPVKKVAIKTDNGYWLKHKNGAVSMFNKSGDFIKEKILYKYAANKIDVIYQGKGEPNKVLLRNYKNAIPLKIYSAELYTDNSIKKKNSTIVNNSPKKFNALDDTTTQLILSKGDNKSAVVEVINKSIEEKIKLDPSNKTQIITDHLHSLYMINPDALFHTVMKLNYSVNEALKKLPKHVRDYMRGSAKHILNEYNKKTKN